MLTADTIVAIIPSGRAAAKEHGPHLKLKNGFTIAEYLKNVVLRHASVVIAPTINYHFYPALWSIPVRPRSVWKRGAISSGRHLSQPGAIGPPPFYVLTLVFRLRALRPDRDLLQPMAYYALYTDLR